MKKKSKRGKWIIDSITNKVLSNKHNIAVLGEKHHIIYLPDGTYNPARYSGPETNLKIRIERNDQRLSYVHQVAEGHDRRYATASTDADIITSDNKMVQLLSKAQQQKLDSNFNINQGMLIKANMLLEDRFGVPKSFLLLMEKQDNQQQV
jgi:hypothetical protein